MFGPGPRRYQTGGRYLLIDLDTENEPTWAVTLTVLSHTDQHHQHLGQGGRPTVRERVLFYNPALSN